MMLDFPGQFYLCFPLENDILNLLFGHQRQLVAMQNLLYVPMAQWVCMDSIFRDGVALV
jgi:hypothetical protein